MSLTGWLVFGGLWLGFGAVTALAADARGRDPGVWFLLGAIFGVFGLAAVLVMQSERRVAARPAAALPRRPAPPSGRREAGVHKGMQVIEEGGRFVVGLSVFATYEEAIVFIDRVQGD